MSIEIFRINENGAGWVALENATTAELLDLELAITFNAPVKILCHICHVEIEKGNACAKHISLNVCKVCEYPHEGLYCSNCFTGERVRVGERKFAKVIRLNEIVKG